MRIITKYVADDGKEFVSEEDCLRYEESNKIKRFKNEISLFYEDTTPISLERIAEGREWNDVFIIKVTSTEAALFLKEAMEDYSNPFIDYEPEPGIYCYDEDNDCWFDLQKALSHWNEIKNKITDGEMMEWVLSDSIVKANLQLVVDRMGWTMEKIQNEDCSNYKIYYPESDSEVFEIIMEQFM
jgi:hypothetical protein